MAAVDERGTRWRKSSRSSMQGNCVEVAFTGNEVRARDSKSPERAQLAFGASTWGNFLDGVQQGRFDRA
nr:DUF397 domain-containing protein [Saccharopolyspora flava]